MYHLQDSYQKSLSIAWLICVNGCQILCSYAGVPYNADDLDIALGEIPLMKKGQPLQFDEKAASKYLTAVTSEHGTVYITLNLGSGGGSGTAWVSFVFLYKRSTCQFYNMQCLTLRCKGVLGT